MTIENGSLILLFCQIALDIFQFKYLQFILYFQLMAMKLHSHCNYLHLYGSIDSFIFHTII